MATTMGDHGIAQIIFEIQPAKHQTKIVNDNESRPIRFYKLLRRLPQLIFSASLV